MEKITNLVTLDFAWQLVTAFLQCLKINLIMNRLIILFSSLAFIALTSCESGQEELPDEAMQGIALQDMLGEEEYWEGNKLEYKELFFLNQTDLFCKTDSNKTYSGIIKVRSRKGTIALLESYSSGLKNGDFFEYHDNGKLKSKRQYKMGMRHGYFYQWLNNGPMVVMMTGYGSVESAVSCMQMGAFDYVVKPFSFEQIEVVVDKVASFDKMRRVTKYYVEESDSQSSDIVGESSPCPNYFRKKNFGKETLWNIKRASSPTMMAYFAKSKRKTRLVA